MSDETKKSYATLYPDLLGVLSHTVQLERWINKAGLSLVQEEELRLIINQLLQSSLNDETLDIFVATKTIQPVASPITDTKKMANDLEDYMDTLMNVTLLDDEADDRGVVGNFDENEVVLKDSFSHPIVDTSYMDLSDVSNIHTTNNDDRSFLQDSLLADSVEINAFDETNVSADSRDSNEVEDVPSGSNNDQSLNDASTEVETDVGATVNMIDFESVLSDAEDIPQQIDEVLNKPSIEEVLAYQAYKQPLTDISESENAVMRQEKWFQNNSLKYNDALSNMTTGEIVSNMMDITPNIHIDSSENETADASIDSSVPIGDLPI